jgi:hypothetical protein
MNSGLNGSVSSFIETLTSSIESFQSFHIGILLRNHLVATHGHIPDKVVQTSFPLAFFAFSIDPSRTQ